MKNQRYRRLAVLAVLSGVLAIGPVAVAEDSATDGVVRIKGEVFVKGPMVYLGEVVEVDESELKERLAGVEVSSAARPGDSKQLNASLIEARLVHAGVNLKHLAPERPAYVRATTMHLDISPETLAASLRAHIEQEMRWDPAVTEIDIPLPRESVVVQDGELTIEWRASPQYKYIGRTNFRGEIFIDGVSCRQVVLRANVETYQEIVVAATDISRGRPVSASQLELEMVALSRAPDGAITELDDVVGLIARKTIFPGQPVTARNVEARRVIKRNQMVPVEINSSGIHIQHRALAMMDGKVGEMIVCANPVTKEEFQGIVRSDGVVEVQ